jgi:REP element-mobilizing transposase RayT
MSTSLRDESPGYHHVITRGNNKRRIYVDDRDRLFFCMTVRRIARKYGWTVLAYCLMDNHYHLLISVGEQGLHRGMSS